MKVNKYVSEFCKNQYTFPFPDLLPYLQLATSLSSFLYTFLGTQSLQVRGEIGRIASPGPSFSLWLLLLGASEVSSRLGLYTAFAWSSRPSAALAAVVVLSLAAVNPLVYATFGGDRMRGGS